MGLAPRTASMWLKLAGLGLTAEDVIERGGIVQTLRGKTAIVADLGAGKHRGRELAEANYLWRRAAKRPAIRYCSCPFVRRDGGSRGYSQDE